jgi:hypothetical protein
MNTHDEELLATTIENAERSDSPFTAAKHVYCVDEQNGAYNGEISFNTNSLNASNLWLSYKEAFIEIPICISCKASVDSSANFNAFYCSLKNSYTTLIDSCSIDINNKSVVSSHPFLNFYVSYKLMTELSADDLNKLDIGFRPDSAGSYTFSNDGKKYSTDGYANCETDIFIDNTLDRPEIINQGHLHRCRQTVELTANAAYGGIKSMNLTSGRKVATNYFSREGAGADQIASFYIMATVHLRHISDFINSLPISKNSELKITLKYNSCNSTITRFAANDPVADTVARYEITNHTQLSGNSNPVLVSAPSDGVTSRGPNTALAGNVVNIAVGVLKNELNPMAGSKFPISACRLVVPAYTMDPAIELKLLSKYPKYTVHYEDVYSYQIKISANENFNSIISNGIPNIERVVILPYILHTDTHKVFRTASIDVYKSVYDTAPATTSPLASLSDVNILVGGVSMIPSSLRYEFETFNQEIAKTGETGGITKNTGLVSPYEFRNCYRYYTVNVGRRSKSDDGIMKSVSIEGTNNTGLPLQLIVFVVFKKQYAFSLLTGVPE